MVRVKRLIQNPGIHLRLSFKLLKKAKYFQKQALRGIP